jgi:hypothetical protein
MPDKKYVDMEPTTFHLVERDDVASDPYTVKQHVELELSDLEDQLTKLIDVITSMIDNNLSSLRKRVQELETQNTAPPNQ